MSRNLVLESPAQPITVVGWHSDVVRLPVDPPIKTAIHDSAVIDHVLLKLTAASGQTGIGHLFTFGAWRAEAVRALVDDIASSIVGRRIENPAALWDQLYRETTFLGRTGVAMMALAAVDTAVWDLWAQALELPLWKALGGKRSRHECYSSDSLWLRDPPDVLERSARASVDAGFRSLKVRVGNPDVQEDLNRVATVVNAVEGKASVMADANQSWTVETALTMTTELKPYGLRWIEEPVDMEDLDGLNRVAASSHVPIAAGESWFGPLEISRCLEASGISVLMPDLQRAGGISGWLRAANSAKDSVQVSPHLFPEVSVHLMAAVANPGPIEYVPWFRDLFVDPPHVHAGDMSLGDRPGLGLEFKSGLV